MGFECWHVHGLSLIYVANTPMADTIFPCAKCLETIGIKKRDGSQERTKITWYKIILQIHCIQREEKLRVQRRGSLNQNKKNILSLSQHSSPSQSDQEQTPLKKSVDSILGSDILHSMQTQIFYNLSMQTHYSFMISLPLPTQIFYISS